MAQNNIYDAVIVELIYRSSMAIGNNAYIEITTDVTGSDTRLPYIHNSNLTFTAEVKLIPSGYTVKSNSLSLTTPNSGTNTSSTTSVVNGPEAVVFTTIGQTYVATASVTLENGINPDIILTQTFTLEAVEAVFAGTKATNNTFTLSNLFGYVYEPLPIEVLMENTTVYPYIVVKAIGYQPAYFKDENGNVIPLSSFTMTTSSGYSYYVLNWATSFNPSSGLKWTVIF